MKVFRALLLASLLSAAPALYSQDAPAADPAPPLPSAPPPPIVPSGPAPSSTDLTPAQDVPVKPPVDPAAPKLDLMPAQDTPAIPRAEETLIPEMIEPVEKPEGTAIPQPDQVKPVPKNKTEASADQLEAMVRFRTVKTRALKDPAVQAQWDISEKAGTDYEKRAALKRYYGLLYARMEKMDRSLKPQIAVRRDEALRRLRQTKIDPTQPPHGVVPDPEPELEQQVQVRTTKKKTTTTKKRASKEKPAEVRAEEPVAR